MIFVLEVFQVFLLNLAVRTSSKSQRIVGRDGFCLLYLHTLYLLKQPHLLILLVTQFTATRLHPVLGRRPLGMAGVKAAHSVWRKIHPPGDVTLKLYCKSLFLHKCL